IRVVNLGPSTEENPFLLAIITSAENQANLDEIREINAQITDPRGLSDAELGQLIKKGKVVVCQSMSLHASEISATQMAPELAYDLVTGEDETTERILDNTIFLMVPCFNPDGQMMVTDWYNEYVGTEYEGAAMPWLYHKYCGHDNNRDA
ncbi:MAG TPA: peptidase M14 family protein, partial [Candidatus Latescibacteria bacterium]|nr:peptidase M14 family protein [Candidatus Latescibacterota bacterium]